VTEHQDLDVLGCVGACEQRQPAQHAASIRYASRKATTGDHAARAAHGEREVGRLMAIALVGGRVRVLGPTASVAEVGGGERAATTARTGAPGPRSPLPYLRSLPSVASPCGIRWGRRWAGSCVDPGAVERRPG
jgi:hypothetical protein